MYVCFYTYTYILEYTNKTSASKDSIQIPYSEDYPIFAGTPLRPPEYPIHKLCSREASAFGGGACALGEGTTHVPRSNLEAFRN